MSRKKLHLYAELVFPISLYSSPYPCTFPISLYLPHIPVPSPYPCTFPISLYLPHIPVPSPYPFTFPISLYLPHIPVLFPISLYSSPYPCTLRSICSIKMLLYQLLIAIPSFSPYPCTLPHIPVPFPYFWTFRPISLDFSPHIPRPIGN